MSHARQLVREAAAVLLKANKVTYGSVVESRIPSTRQLWPYLLTFVDVETSEPMTEDGPSAIWREMSLIVVGMLRLPGTGDQETIEDKIDAMAAEIETKLSFSTLQAAVGQVQSCHLTNTSIEVIVDPDDVVDHAEVTQIWLVRYATMDGLPETLI